ncbi:MAG TPA: hypothetical protein PLL78_01315 [Fimbriimonadaceae bacterium]|nr:hypothetical protein [Fimbriimonadaceae bacterium]HRJ95300.1 hypothetical protein [Fimbriimonadaceae bacterium]
MAIVVVVGCGSKQPVEKQVVDEKPIEPRFAASGPLELTARGEKQERLWTVRAKSSTMAFHGEGALSGTLDDVEGELFDADKAVSRFKALGGEADQAKRELELKGEVTLTADEEQAKLTANEVRWIEAEGLIEATGAVRVKSPDYEAGPFAKLWATPDLKDVGTPDMFKARKRK